MENIGIYATKDININDIIKDTIKEVNEGMSLVCDNLITEAENATNTLEEYNKLIDMHTKREELPEKIEVKKISSKWWRWLKRASCSLLHYNKNAEQQKLIKRCINETASTIRENLINGYWRGDLSDYFKDGNFDVSLKSYKDSSYYNVMQWLDKKK